MANVLVRVVSGLPAGKTWPAPTEPVTMDQDGCQYVPHVMGIMVGQPFKVLNSDGVLHNVHALPKVNAPFNMAMPPDAQGSRPRPSARKRACSSIKCDVHPWMQSYMGVFSHPFFAVTGADGKFTIANLPAGTYEIEAWHEKLGTQKATVTVGASDTKTASFKFAPPDASRRGREPQHREREGPRWVSKPTVAHHGAAATTRTTRSSASGGSTSSPIDHKTIGIQYAVTGLLFLLFGFC